MTNLRHYMMVAALMIGISAAIPGCLIPCAFPTISQTPPASLGDEAAEAHVFRVDITRVYADVGGIDYYTLYEVPSWPQGWVLPRTKVSATYGIFVFGIALNYPVYVSHSLAMRIYRPGYELVELDSWDLPESITWKSVLDLHSQERALDHLFLTNEKAERAEAEHWPLIGRCLSAGSASKAHRRALLFGASEYERLAACEVAAKTENKEARGRLQSKAVELRKLADKSEPSPGLWHLMTGD